VLLRYHLVSSRIASRFICKFPSPLSPFVCRKFVSHHNVSQSKDTLCRKKMRIFHSNKCHSPKVMPVSLPIFFRSLQGAYYSTAQHPHQPCVTYSRSTAKRKTSSPAMFDRSMCRVSSKYLRVQSRATLYSVNTDHLGCGQR